MVAPLSPTWLHHLPGVSVSCCVLLQHFEMVCSQSLLDHQMGDQLRLRAMTRGQVARDGSPLRIFNLCWCLLCVMPPCAVILAVL